MRFLRVRIFVDMQAGEVVYKTSDFHKPWTIGVTPDPTIQAEIDQLNADLRPILAGVIGSSDRYVPRSDSCGRLDGRLCESLVGNIVTDAMRQLGPGFDFAITNSGGLRADLTCPTTDSPDDFCPGYTPPPFPITRGQVLGVLPFGNLVASVELNGAELKTFLENGVSQMPAANGRFPQVSGLCFTYDISAPAGSRVTRRSPAGRGRHLHGPGRRPDGGVHVPHRHERLHGGGRRRLPERRQPRALAGDHGPGRGRLDHGELRRSARAIQGRIVCTTTGATACPVITAP